MFWISKDGQKFHVYDSYGNYKCGKFAILEETHENNYHLAVSNGYEKWAKFDNDGWLLEEWDNKSYHKTIDQDVDGNQIVTIETKEKTIIYTYHENYAEKREISGDEEKVYLYPYEESGYRSEDVMLYIHFVNGELEQIQASNDIEEYMDILDTKEKELLEQYWFS